MEEITLRNAARKWEGKHLLATPKSSLFSDPHTSPRNLPVKATQPSSMLWKSFTASSDFGRIAANPLKNTQAEAVPAHLP
jgi:hypothetical protein